MSRPPVRRGPSRLRTRLVVRIGLLVALLSLGVGIATYFSVRDTLVSERERSASQQFVANATLLTSALRTPDVDEAVLLASLRPQVRARELLRRGDEWFTSSLQVQPSDVSPMLLDAVGVDVVVRQRYRTSGAIVLGVGTELEDGSVYIELFSVADLERTLLTLRNTLAGTGALATVIGMAMGWLIARRIASPLEQVSEASARLAAGDLDTRIDSGGDEELARITASFNRMAAALQARIARETRFAADVSHELRSPLTTLANAATVLERRRHELSPDGQEAIDLLCGDVRRFERMVADLIEIGRHEAGTMPVNAQEVRVDALVTSLVARAGLDDVDLFIDTTASTSWVSLDVRRMERAFGNVVDNAAAYGGGVVHIGASVVTSAASHDASPPTPAVAIVIDDDGPGVPPGERDTIFERFARGVHGERRRTNDGSGLGLALARENIHRCGGTIDVTDRPGHSGARFVLTVPLSEAGDDG